MQPRRFAAGTILLSCLLAIILGASCARLHSTSTSGAQAGGKLYVVTADLTAFYLYSPRQGNGPDKRIPRGTPVKLIRRSPAFCKIQLLSGEKGFVANDDIGPASGTLVASNNPTEKPVAGSSEWRAEIPEPRPNAPELPLPEFEPTPIALPPVPGN